MPTMTVFAAGFCKVTKLNEKNSWHVYCRHCNTKWNVTGTRDLIEAWGRRHTLRECPKPNALRKLAGC